VVVLVSLVGVLTFTSALLLAIAPAPLSPQTTSTLLASETTPSFDELYDQTAVSVESHRWNYIYIHHSNTTAGNSQTLAGSENVMPPDHFLIGNGEGCGDGDIEVGSRWQQQLAPGRTPGSDWIVQNCISICIVGDFNKARPTPLQQRQLIELVQSLRSRLHIPADRVFFDQKPDSAAGIGAYFPANDFRREIASAG
jgi:hypothetical protein